MHRYETRQASRLFGRDNELSAHIGSIKIHLQSEDEIEYTYRSNPCYRVRYITEYSSV